MKKMNMDAVAAEMIPHLRACHDFVQRQGELVELFKSLVLKQVREGCVVEDLIVVWEPRQGDVDLFVMKPRAAGAPAGVPIEEASKMLRKMLYDVVRRVCAEKKALAVLSIGCSCEYEPKGVIVTYEGVRFPARAWVSEATISDAHVFTDVRDFRVMDRSEAREEQQPLWEMLPIECYSRGRAVQPGGQA